MIKADGTIRTDDMAFAAVLTCAGMSPSMERVVTRHRTFVVWNLPSEEVTEAVRKLADDYLAGSCRVEPRRYMREVRAVRRELHKFLEHNSVRIVSEA